MASKTISTSIFSSAEQKTSLQSQGAAPKSTSNSPSRKDSAASAQHWSPLGHGASAFSDASLAHGEHEEEPFSVLPEGIGESAGQRSPLRALSSNSPTRLHHAQPGSLSSAGSSKRRPSSQNNPLPLSGQAGGALPDDYDDSSAPTMVLGPTAAAQDSPLPPNALVAYSSDEDDWHNAGDVTESKLPVFSSRQHHTCHISVTLCNLWLIVLCLQSLHTKAGLTIVR